MAPFSERLQNAQSIARHPRIRVTDIENRLGTRFTAQTVKRLQQRYPSIRFVWLMGADNLLQIPRWRNWLFIFQSVPIAILDRGPYSNFYRALSGQAAQKFKHSRVPVRRAHRLADMDAPAWVYLRDMKPHPASATGIRESVLAGRPAGPARNINAAKPESGSRP
jgi:nicotinate-nucleotide adenylyltransferase